VRRVHSRPLAAFNNPGAVYEFSDAKKRAEPLFLRAITLDQKVLGPESSKSA